MFVYCKYKFIIPTKKYEINFNRYKLQIVTGIKYFLVRTCSKYNITVFVLSMKALSNILKNISISLEVIERKKGFDFYS